MKTEILTQLKEILKEAKTDQEIAEIAGIIEEAKGKLHLEEKEPGFWLGKTACWEMFACPPEVRNECPAPKNRTYPCWEIEGTYCKLSEYGMKGDDTQICESCRVYKKFGHREPIKLKLLGKGFNPATIAVGEKEELEEHANIRTQQWREGDIVRVKDCADRLYLVGAVGEIKWMQTQKNEEYSIRPIWVRFTTGVATGKTFGFWRSELEPVAMKNTK